MRRRRWTGRDPYSGGGQAKRMHRRTQGKEPAALPSLDGPEERPVLRPAKAAGNLLYHGCPNRCVVHGDDGNPVGTVGCGKGARHPGGCVYPARSRLTAISCRPTKNRLPCQNDLHPTKIAAVGACSWRICGYTGCQTCITAHFRRTGHPWKPTRSAT